ncbi:MAG: glycerate kinase [Planctomycetota bacterium]
MKILIAPDSFKECLSAADAARAMARGARRAAPRAVIREMPIADGGEGTVDALVRATDGRFLRVTVTSPLGTPVRARYGISGDGRTAFVEMAEASGLHLVPPAKRNPLRASTYGTGELIHHALDRGVRRILIGIGGSATVDGGAGMAAALGARLLDRDGRDIPRGGGGLAAVHAIDRSGLDRRLASVEIVAACDVKNPLCGPRGAAAVFGPQKGATPAMVRTLNRNLARFAAGIRRSIGKNVARLPGAGAAGGLGAGLVAFTGARLEPGIAIVLDTVRFREELAGADIVLTGEGCLDGQSVMGKAVGGVAAAAENAGVPVIALAGCLGPGHERVLAHGVAAVFGLFPRPIRDMKARRAAFRRTPEHLATLAENVVRLFIRRAMVSRCFGSKTPRLRGSKTPRLPDSQTPRLRDSETPRLPDSETSS